MNTCEISEFYRDAEGTQGDEDTTALIEQKDGRIAELEMALQASANIIKKKAELHQSKSDSLCALNGKVHYLEGVLKEREASIREIEPAVYSVRCLKKQRRTGAVEAAVSVVIPVLNGGTSFRRLLEKLRSQKRVNTVELIIIDSGSTDGSLEAANDFGAKIIKIPGKAFNHGATRQIGVDHATGEYVLYTVQDVTVTNDYWLYSVITTMEANPALAVLTIRQQVSKEADLYSRWNNTSTYDSYGLNNDIEYYLKMPDMLNCLSDHAKRRITFIDDVCACYRSKVFRKYGFAAIDNAEDIEVGVRMAQGGERLGMLNSHGVYHWHSYEPYFFLKRYFHGVKAFVVLLGHRIPDLNSVDINSLEDIGTKAAMLLDLLDKVFEMWHPDGPVSPADIKTFLHIYHDTIKNLSEKSLPFSTRGMERAGLKALFDEIGYDKKAHFSLLKRNYFFAMFNPHMDSLIKYYFDNYQHYRADKVDFCDAFLKIVASDVGNYLGYWYMDLVKKGRQNEVEHLYSLLARGVCNA